MNKPLNDTRGMIDLPGGNRKMLQVAAMESLTREAEKNEITKSEIICWTLAVIGCAILQLADRLCPEPKGKREPDKTEITVGEIICWTLALIGCAILKLADQLCPEPKGKIAKGEATALGG